MADKVTLPPEQKVIAPEAEIVAAGGTPGVSPIANSPKPVIPVAVAAVSVVVPEVAIVDQAVAYNLTA